MERVREDYKARHKRSSTSMAYLVVTHAPVVSTLSPTTIFHPPYCASFEMIYKNGETDPMMLKGINDNYLKTARIKKACIII